MSNVVRVAVLAIVLSVFPHSAWSDHKAWYGIAFNLQITGLWDQTLESATLSEVAADSPAESVKLMVGDTVLELNGVPVPGATGENLKKLKKWLETKKVGDALHLTLSRGTGEPFSVVLKAAPRPH